MAVTTRTAVKAYFETGDKPTEAQFVDAWDSTVFKASGAGAPASAPTAVGDTYIDTTADEIYIAAGTATAADWKKVNQSTKTESIIVSCSDLTTALTTGTSVAYLRMPYAFTLVAVRASVLTAPTGSGITVDINESGTSVLSTEITIDATEKTSTTAATPPVISDAALADDAEITIDIDAVGSTIAGAGLIVQLIGYKS